MTRRTTARGHPSIVREGEAERDAKPPLTPGALYRELCPLDGHMRLFAVDINGRRCFDLTVRDDEAARRLIDRWREDARTLGGQGLALVK